MIADLLIRDGAIVHADKTQLEDIVVQGGKIHSIVPRGTAVQARSTVDAAGKFLLPGLVDAHVHLREPGLVHKEGFLTGTMAAAAGGVTTVMVMPTDKPITLTPRDFEDKRKMAEGQCFVDFALQAGLGADATHIPELVRLGAISFEVFLADVASELLVADGQSLLEVLDAAAAHEAVVGVTPGDHDVVTRRTAQIMKNATGNVDEFPPSRPPVSEALGVARACVAARETGARIHLRQVSCAAAASVVAAFRPLANISAEVTPHNLLLDESELRRQGPFAKVAPPLRPRSDLEAMQRALRDGIVDIVATDHAPHLQKEKEKGADNIWAAPGGFPGLQTMFAALLVLVERKTISLNDLVRVACDSPARLFGLGGRKGTLAPGADADILVLDLSRSGRIANEDQHSKARVTPFNGMTHAGVLERVFLRGVEIAEEGKVSGSPRGRFIRP